MTAVWDDLNRWRSVTYFQSEKVPREVESGVKWRVVNEQRPSVTDVLCLNLSKDLVRQDEMLGTRAFAWSSKHANEKASDGKRCLARLDKTWSVHATSRVGIWWPGKRCQLYPQKEWAIKGMWKKTMESQVPSSNWRDQLPRRSACCVRRKHPGDRWTQQWRSFNSAFRRGVRLSFGRRFWFQKGCSHVSKHLLHFVSQKSAVDIVWSCFFLFLSFCFLLILKQASLVV